MNSNIFQQLKLSDFQYDLPENAIAKFPPTIRGNTNLFYIDISNILGKISAGTTIHEAIYNIPISKYSDLYKFLSADDLVILNNTKVMHSRLETIKRNKKLVEIFILERHSQSEYGNDGKSFKAIIRGRVRNNTELFLVSDPEVKFLIVEKENEFGTLRIHSDKYATIDQILEEYGHVPIPPYLDRTDIESDKSRYQTISAEVLGSVAAPTASLNITQDLLENLSKHDIRYEYLTLHCGYGTFASMRTENISDHQMHSEYFEISRELIEQLEIYRQNKKQNILAVGTTVTRTLEYIYQNNLPSNFLSQKNNNMLCGEANIFLAPGKKFQVVDKLLTNFHAPNSTPLFLTLAFVTDKIAKNYSREITAEDVYMAKDILFTIYKYAIDSDCKLLSYGDSMLLV